MKTGIELIAEERARQINQEGWTPEHDDAHTSREMLFAANCYAFLESGYPSAAVHAQGVPPSLWPWDRSRWKPSDDPVRNLVKAGALISAEIDRLQRMAAK